MPKSRHIAAVKGMNDILPPDSARWLWLESRVREVMACHGYRNIRTPLVESTDLFVRGLGAVTDVVEKEMYSFDDRADKHGSAQNLSLRPENTAGVVRAVVQHKLLHDGGKRLYYMGPMFRRERPQRGRYRQFHQVGAEAMGFAGPEIDAELILLAVQLWERLGISGWQLQLNCLGEPAERAEHRQALVAYLEQHQDALDADARRRLHTNPLRILDTKNPELQGIVECAPRLIDFLGDTSRQHFSAVQEILVAAAVPFHINPRLVRGLDYYNLTVFEFVTDELGAQGTICGGGRYDYLVEQVGGRAAPAVGWALGAERVLELLDVGAVPQPALDAYAVVADTSLVPVAMACLQILRSRGVTVQMEPAGENGYASLKAQFRRADASGARHALVFGADEVAAGQVSVKPLRDMQAPQVRMDLAGATTWADQLKYTA